MNGRENRFKKVAVVSLSVLYLLIALTYVFYLPKYNMPRTGNGSRVAFLSSHIQATHSVSQAFNTSTQYWQRAYKCIAENKHNVLNSILPGAALLLTLMMGAYALKSIAKSYFLRAKFSPGASRPAYLYLRTLRI
jgi:hypothetical protein